MTYDEAVAYLYDLRRFGIRPGLETIRTLLGALGDPQDAFPAIHVGGTNGKGSTSAFLAAILGAAGMRVGLYTSPHLLSFTERIRVDGAPIPEGQVASLTAELHSACARLFDSDPQPGAEPRPHPTFFEFTTAMGLLHFARSGVDRAVVEVGLGGRFDATNVLRPDVAVITNIALEHQEYLGRRVDEIAAEKAGIVKAKTLVVTAARGAALDPIRAACRTAGGTLIEVPERYRVRIRRSDLGGQRFDLEGGSRGYRDLGIGLLGRHQVENAATAVAAAEALEALGVRIGPDAIAVGLATARWPGRLHIVDREPLLFLDGAHNPAAATVLAEFLREQRDAFDRLILVFGVLRDKDWEGMLSALGPVADLVVLTRPEGDRAADPSALIGADRFCPKLEVEREMGRALSLARQMASARDAILVTGSLFTVARALRALGVTRV